MNALTVSTTSTVTRCAAKADGVARRRVPPPRAPVTRALHRAGRHDALGTNDVALPSALSRRAALLAAGSVALTPLSAASAEDAEDADPAPSAHARGAGRPRQGGRRGAKRVGRFRQAGVRFRAQPVPPNAAGVLAALTPGPGEVPTRPDRHQARRAPPAIHVRDGRRAGHDGHGHVSDQLLEIASERWGVHTAVLPAQDRAREADGPAVLRLHLVHAVQGCGERDPEVAERVRGAVRRRGNDQGDSPRRKLVGQ